MRVQAALPWLAVAALLGAAGCLDGSDGACADELDAGVVTPWLKGKYMHTAPDTAWQTVVFSPQDMGVDEASLVASTATMGWNASNERVSQPGEARFDIVTVTPAGPAGGDLKVAYRVEAADPASPACTRVASGHVAWDLAAPMDGMAAEPGQGVHVMTAGFFGNGTLFYTNIKEIDQDKGWPRWEHYLWEGGDPLPVYVYDASREDRPAYWSVTTYGTPAGSPTKDLTLWDYYTTIPGFNQALKGLSTNTVHVAHLTPEQAYTRAGNEAHPLYGESLVFYIKVLEVVDLPCPEEFAMLEACQLPEPLAA